MAPHSVGPEPGELSRAISELDLNSLRGGGDGTTDENQISKRYPRDQLLGLKSKSCSTEDFGISINVPEIATGTQTPPAPPRVPPPTPDHLSLCPNSGTSTPGARLPVTPEEPEKKKEGAVIEGAEGGTQVADDVTQMAGAGEGEPKKKKKKKGSGKNKKPAPTGFEEFYADPPLTPDEYEEERDTYDENRPFAERIEICIQRYRARRKLDSIRSNILTKYFALGGIEVGSKMFNGGLDKETLDNSTAAEIAAIQATDFVRSSNSKYYDPSDTENWVVDWEGIVKGFLSCRATKILGDGEEEMKMYCAVVKNFLNYVLTHEVCREYTKEVMAARKLCDVAEKEYRSIRELREMFPGDFNIAASTLFGQTYKLHLEANIAWGGVEDGANAWSTNIPLLSLPVCQFVFGGIVALIGDKSHYENAKNGDTHVVKSETRFLEVVDVHHTPADMIETFSRLVDPRGLGAFKPVGKLFCKYWEGPGYYDEDKTDDGKDEVEGNSVEEFWLEDEILQLCYPGLKLEVDVHELNIGVKYFDRVAEVFPSFHLYLPNEKMTGWKEPVPNERPPPTEDDPDAEEKIMDAIFKDDANEFEKA